MPRSAACRRIGLSAAMLCALTLSGVGASSLIGGGTAYAQIDCINAYGSLFDGFISTAADPSGNTYEGTSTVLTAATAPICDTGSQDPNTNFDYTWVMIHQNNSAPGGTTSGYAQMGFYRGWGSCNYFTAEYDRDVNDVYHRFIDPHGNGCLQDGGQNQYWVQYINGALRMNVDVTIMAVTPWNPYTYWNLNYGPWHTEFDSETKYLGSDVPTTAFNAMEVQQFNDSWTTTLPAMYSSCPWPDRYNRTGTVVNDSFDIATIQADNGFHC